MATWLNPPKDFTKYSYKTFIHQFLEFFDLRPLIPYYPGFFAGLAMLLGVYGAILEILSLYFFIGFFFYLKEKWDWQMLAYPILTLASFGYFQALPNHPMELPLDGIAYFEINDLSLKKNGSNQKWVYKGRLTTFKGMNGIQYYNIPCSLTVPNRPDVNRPLANCSYRIEGTLRKTPHGNFFLKYDLEKPWNSISYSTSLAENRYYWKTSLTNYLQLNYSDRRVVHFLNGLMTGNFSDKTLSFQLGRFGLQHIMAISGFHFALVASLLGLLLKSLFFNRLSNLFLILTLTLYFLFLGCSPSIMRAWISIMLFLIGQLFQQKSFGINNLGIALLIILIIDPPLSKNLGFQMSFLATLGILLINPLIEQKIKIIIPSRSLSKAIEMGHLHQWGYCILVFFRRSLSLTFSVLLLTLPLTLFYFKKFPLLSVIYNLFFPYLTSLSMTFFILSMLIHLAFPFLGPYLHTVTEIFTQFLLNLAYNIPRSLDYHLRLDFPLLLLVPYLIFVIFIALKKHQQNLLRGNFEQDPSFIY